MQKTLGITILSVFALLCLVNSAQSIVTSSTADEVSSLLQQYNRQIIPDVMGFVNVAESSGDIPKQYILQLDDYTLLAPWPVTVAGNSFEGGICVNIDADPELEIIYNTWFTVHAWNLDTTDVPGWPQTLPHAAEGAPAFGDIDGDGVPEIVVGATYTMTNGAIYAFELDGTPVTGFPINHGYASRTVVLADLDGDNDLEIITNKRMWPLGEQWVYNGDGTVYPGWPQPLAHVPASSAAVGDITGDGVPEIIGESYDALYAWDTSGNLLAGFPFFMPFGAVNSYSSPVLVDLDGDSLREIVFGTHILGGGGYVFVLNHDGTEMPGWPRFTNYWIYGPPAVGYIDADSILDVVVGDQVLSPSPTDYIYGWNANGQVLPGFPIGPINAINNQVALADLDNDGMTELLVDDNTGPNGIYLAFNHDGTLVTGFPLQVVGSSFFNMPCLVDLDHDGFMNIVGGSRYESTNAKIYVWTSDVPYNEASIQIPVWQYNNRHDGVVPLEVYVLPEVEVTLTPHNPPIQIPVSGDTFDFTFRIDYLGTASEPFDGWMMIMDLDSVWTGPVMEFELPPQGTGTYSEFDSMYTVEAGLDTGMYVFETRVGYYPDDVWDTDAFTFEIIDTTSNVPDYSVTTPRDFVLYPAFPNPFNPTTTLSFSIPVAANVSLKVYDINGRYVKTLLNNRQRAGIHKVRFDGGGLSSGIYFYELKTADFQAINKMILLK